MKFTHAILILILSIVIQVSFIRLFDLFLFEPNLLLVVLFLLCYFLSFEKLLILTIVAGIMIDSLSSVSFGSTSIAALGACSLSFYLRKNILKSSNFANFLLNSLVTFSVFYFLLAIANIFLEPLMGYSAFFKMININLIGEILLNFVFSIFGYHFVKYYKNRKIYGFIGNVKISS